MVIKIAETTQDACTMISRFEYENSWQHMLLIRKVNIINVFEILQISISNKAK